MVRIEINDAHLHVEMLGLHKLWALKRELDIPIGHIKSVERYEPGSCKGGIRLGGTSVPSLLRAGRYYVDKKWVFWDLSDMDNAIRIELADEDYSSLIVETEKPDAAVELISGLIGHPD